MKSIKDFLRYFGVKDFSYAKMGKKYYQMSDELRNLQEKIDRDMYYGGMFLGEDVKHGFKPSLGFLDMLSQKSDRKITLSSKAEFLFLCGRDIFGAEIKSATVDNGLVFVQNLDGHNLGYGKIVDDLKKKNEVVVKNLLDRGDFLRREMGR